MVWQQSAGAVASPIKAPSSYGRLRQQKSLVGCRDGGGADMGRSNETAQAPGRGPGGLSHCFWLSDWG